MIPHDVVPGRMGLLITLFLVLVNLFISITTNLPNTKLMTSISIWILACISFVQGAMFEYGCILFFKHVAYNPESDLGQKNLHRIDTFCLFLSIIAFAIFNFIYWVYLVPQRSFSNMWHIIQHQI